eukprot:c17279_g2_i1 orf=195-1535(+)
MGKEAWIMNGQKDKLVAVALMVLVLSFLAKLFIKRRRASCSDGVFPRGPPAWPILGHLPLLAAGCPHKTLADLSHKHGYGPIIGLRLGSRHAAVISSASLARDLLHVHDKVFANRPAYQFVETLLYGYDSAVAFSHYSPLFARLRKMYTLELFTTQRLHQLQYIRQEEAGALLHRLHQASCDGTQAVNLGALFGEMSSNTISRLLQSKTLSEATNLTGAHGDGASLPELIEKLVHEAAPILGDFIPWLKCMDLLPKRNMKYTHDCLDKVIDSILRERRQAMRSSPLHELPHDFLQVLLSKEDSSHNEGFHHQEDRLTTQQIKAIILDILSAGTHTTALTLEWAMAELLRNPSCLIKVRDEIDAVMKAGTASAPLNPSENGMRWEEDRLITEEDLPKLPYLESTVKEVFRLHPVVPLLLPRISSQATKVDKYTLPTHTHVFVNVWAI